MVKLNLFFDMPSSIDLRCNVTLTEGTVLWHLGQARLEHTSWQGPRMYNTSRFPTHVNQAWRPPCWRGRPSPSSPLSRIIFKLSKGTPEIPSDQFCVYFQNFNALVWGLVEWMKKKKEGKKCGFFVIEYLALRVCISASTDAFWVSLICRFHFCHQIWFLRMNYSCFIPLNVPENPILPSSSLLRECYRTLYPFMHIYVHVPTSLLSFPYNGYQRLL